MMPIESATAMSAAHFPRVGGRRLVIGACLAIALAACGTTVPPGIEPIDYTAAPRDLISVASIAETHLVRLRGAGRYLSLPERQALDAFVTNVAANRPESLRVALQGAAAPGQMRLVADALVADGVDPSNIVHGPRDGAPRGAVLVAVERAIAVQPACPGWVDHVSAPEDNRIHPNLGCSNVSNLAAMVGDPHHLIKGASSIYLDGERGATAVANYRSDKVKELPVNRENFNIIPSR